MNRLTIKFSESYKGPYGYEIDCITGVQYLALKCDHLTFIDLNMNSIHSETLRLPDNKIESIAFKNSFSDIRDSGLHHQDLDKTSRIQAEEICLHDFNADKLFNFKDTKKLTLTDMF